MKNLCGVNGFCFVNTDNISEGNLYKNRLHFLEAGKRILDNNCITIKIIINLIKAQREQSFLTKDTNKDTHPIDCTDLQMLKKDRLNYPRNPLIGYLDINSIRIKISDIREVFGKLQLGCFILSETKIDKRFPSAQFNIHDYEIRNRRDSHKHGGGLRKGFITERMKEYETKLSETISTEFTVSKKK